MPEIGYASMAVIPTFKGLQGDLERGSSKALAAAGASGGDKFGKSAAGAAKSRFSGAAKSIVGPLVGAFAAVKVGDFFKDSVAEARESQKVGALTAQVIKTTGSAAKVSAKQVGDLATAISNKTGIDDEAIQRGANLVLTFKGIRNEAGKGNKIFNRSTKIITDMAASLAGGSGGEIDLHSASIQVGKALNDPIKGVSALAKVGVSFTKMQKDQIKALVEGGDANASVATGLVADTKMFNDLVKQQKGDVAKTVHMLTNELNPAQKKVYDHYAEGGHTLEAQKRILKELNSEFGGAAAAQATAGEKISVAWGNIKEGIGTALLPVVDDVETALLKKGIPAAQKFVDWFGKKGLPALKDFGRKAEPIVSDVFGKLLDFGRKAEPVVRDVLGKAKDFLKEAQPYAEGFVDAFNKLPKNVKVGIGAAALLGFGATKIPGVKGATGGLAKTALGQFTKGGVQKVYVVNPGFGGAAGRAGGRAAAEGGAAGLATRVATNPATLYLGPAAAAAIGAAAAEKAGVGKGKAFSQREFANVAGANAGSAGGGQMASPFKPSDFDDEKPKRLAEALNKAQFYSGLARQNIGKLPNDLARGMNGAEALKSQVFGIETSTKRSRAAVVSLVAALEAARQKAIKVEQGVSAARSSKVDRQLGGGMYVANMNVHGTSLSEVRRDAQHQHRSRAYGSETFR